MHRTVILALAAGIPASAALAGGAGDIAIALRNGQIVTGLGDHDFYPDDRDFPERVFGADFEDLGGTIVGEEPGWLGPFADVDPLNDPFPTGSTLGFDILDRLLVWNGSPTVAGGGFNETTNSMRIFDTSPGNPEVFTPATQQVVPGFTVVANTADGPSGFDEHPFYQLVNNEAGVFLLNIRITSSDSSIAASEPIWLVFNNGLDELTHDAAIEFTEQFIVPAPSAAAVLAIGGLMASRRRR